MALSGWASVGPYLSQATTDFANEPLTMACWFKPSDLSTFQVLMETADSSGSFPNGYQLRLVGNTANNPIRAAKRSGGSTTSLASINGPADGDTGIWLHAAAVYVSDTSRFAYFNGAKSVEDTTSKADPTVQDIFIGINKGAATDDAKGSIAEAAIWDVALTDDEIAALAKGVSPLLIRPESLKRYWPLLNDAARGQDVTGRGSLTETGTLTKADHCRVFYPSARWIAPKAATSSIGSGALSVAGVAAASFTGASIAAGVFTSAGVATASFTGAATVEAVLSAAGVGAAAFVGDTAGTTESGAVSIAGVATASFATASIAAAAFTVAGNAAGTWSAPSIVEGVFSAAGAASVGFVSLSAKGVGAYPSRKGKRRKVLVGDQVFWSDQRAAIALAVAELQAERAKAREVKAAPVVAPQVVPEFTFPALQAVPVTMADDTAMMDDEDDIECLLLCA